MASVTGTFSDAGVSGELLVREGESFTFAIDYSADFDGGLFLEYSDNGGQYFNNFQTFAIGYKTDVTTTLVSGAKKGNYRFRCILDPDADPLVLTGTAAITISDVSESLQSITNQSGQEVLGINETGLAVTGTMDVSGGATFGSTIASAGNVSITNTAPTLELADSTTSAKDLTIKVDADKAQLRESAGAAGSLLVLDLANNRVGVATASPTVALDVTGAAAISSTATVGSTLTVTGNLLTGAGVGAKNGATVTAVEHGSSAIHKTVLTLASTPVTVANTTGASFGGVKLYDFPEGRILILGVTANLSFDWAGTDIAATGSGDFSLGTTITADATIDGTDVNLLPSTGLTDPFVAGVGVGVGALAASAHIDGTGGAIDANLNIIIDDADVDDAASDIVLVTGTVTMAWINLGDY